MNTADKLITSGIYPNLKGFRYIVDAVEIYQPGMPIGNLYIDVARKNNATPSRVERSIRHAKEKGDKSKTNGEFISVMKHEQERG